MKKRRFADGGDTPALDELAAGKETGRFSEDVYARAKRFLENKEEQKPSAKPSSAKAPTAKPAVANPAESKGSEPRKPTPEQEAEYERIKASDKPLEGVYPETWLVGGGAMRAAANAIGKPLARAAVEGWKAGRPGATVAKELAKGPADEAVEAARVAKIYCARAAFTVCETSIQVHGGIGNTWECLAHVYLRRVLADTEMWPVKLEELTIGLS